MYHDTKTLPLLLGVGEIGTAVMVFVDGVRPWQKVQSPHGRGLITVLHVF